MRLKWMNADHTALLWEKSAGQFRFVEPHHPEWGELVGRSGIEPHDAEPSKRPEPPIEEQRAAMVCTPAQMRIALHRMGKLAQVQAIAESDPEAAILWEFASVIKRTSPLIDAMAGDFTPEEVDDIFRAAMALEV